MIQPQQGQHGCMEVIGVYLSSNRMESNWVRGADHFAAFDPAPRHPGRKSVGVVIAALFPLHHRRATKLSYANHQGTFEQASLFQITEQAGKRQIRLGSIRPVQAIMFGMTVPVAVVKMYESHSSLDHAPGDQTEAAKLRGGFAVHPVHSPTFRFAAEVNEFRSCRLHPKRQFIVADPRRQLVSSVFL
jgi:hypothetical protein